MGQYYNALIEVNGERQAYYHQVDGEYMMAKLMEHSYWANPFVLAVTEKLWRNKGRIAWVGDYAGSDDFNWKEEFADAHAEGTAREELKYSGFRLEGKYFINHSKKVFIDLDKYKELLKDIKMVINPVPLLTAVGNGKGGGDFWNGTGKTLIGTWAWDELEITDQSLHEHVYKKETESWSVCIKREFREYKDVTQESLFIEQHGD